MQIESSRVDTRNVTKDEQFRCFRLKKLFKIKLIYDLINK